MSKGLDSIRRTGVATECQVPAEDGRSHGGHWKPVRLWKKRANETESSFTERSRQVTEGQSFSRRSMLKTGASNGAMTQISGSAEPKAVHVSLEGNLGA